MKALWHEVLMLRVFQDAKRWKENFPLELTWKLTERHIIRANIKRPDPVIFDVGSNLGSSIAFYRSMFPNASIVGFEPDPDTFRRLQSRFRNASNVRLFNKGVSSKPGRLRLHRNAVSATNSLHEVNKESEWVKSAPMLRDISPVDVDLVALDDVARELSIDRIDYLKSDTQGHEPEVLAGAHRLLSEKRIQLMKLEVLPGDYYARRVSLFELESTLYPLGYTLSALNDMHLDSNAAFKYFDAFFSVT